MFFAIIKILQMFALLLLPEGTMRQLRESRCLHD
jgi:hypothetical protein